MSGRNCLKADECNGFFGKSMSSKVTTNGPKNRVREACLHPHRKPLDHAKHTLNVENGPGKGLPVQVASSLLRQVASRDIDVVRDGLGTRMYLELFANASNVSLHRRQTDADHVGHFLVKVATGQQSQYFGFTRR